jgi:glutamine amidotransferase
MSVVAVIDYGMGNIRSVARAVEHVAAVKVLITNDADRICAADRVIFPGVGALRDCMSELQRLELDEAIRISARTRPFLGICLGMQALLERSEENDGTLGLGIIAGEVRRFVPASGIKIPHMGWNQVHQQQEHPLWQGIAQDSRFYFVHSYYVVPLDNDIVMGTSDHGQRFVSALGRENVFATQFHPEKSQHAGLQLLKNFIGWDGGR